MLLWNSRDKVRALRTQKPAIFKARGRSFGPITTSATTPISSNSGQPMSNSIGGSALWQQHQMAPQSRDLSQKAAAAAITGQKCVPGANHPQRPPAPVFSAGFGSAG